MNYGMFTGKVAEQALLEKDDLGAGNTIKKLVFVIHIENIKKPQSPIVAKCYSYSGALANEKIVKMLVTGTKVSLHGDVSSGVYKEGEWVYPRLLVEVKGIEILEKVQTEKLVEQKEVLRTQSSEIEDQNIPSDEQVRSAQKLAQQFDKDSLQDNEILF